MFTTSDLFGKFHSPLRMTAQSLARNDLHHLELLLVQRVNPSLLATNPDHANSRQRLFTPRLTLAAFLDQVLSPGSSCREASHQIRAYYQKLPHPKHVDEDSSAYCQARARWTLQELVEIRRDLAHRMASNPLPMTIPFPCPIKLIDGTSLNAPDTPANRLAYPQSKDQAPLCGFPLLRLVGIFSLESGALLERACGPHTTLSENALYQQLWPTLNPGDILLGDRNFSSWASIASLLHQGVESLFRLHSSRNVDFRKGLRSGPNERLVTWPKPVSRPANLSVPQWQALPQAVQVRLIRFRVVGANGRSKKIVLVTTLLNSTLWPWKLLADLYARRWKVELFFDDLKTTLNMDMLSCLSPAMIQKELEVHLIAYNLIRSIMNEAACVCHVPLDRLSFKGTLDTLRQYVQIIAQIPRSRQRTRQRIYADMLAAIAEDQVPDRPGRFEPRCRKRRPKRYPLMTHPRHVLRAAGRDSFSDGQKPRA